MKDIEHVALNPLDRSGVGKMIKIIRDKQVLLDSDFTILYGVETKRINEQVKRNIERFHEKFCFQLNSDEVESVKSQIATSRGTSFFAGQNGGRRKNPYAFTEQGVAIRHCLSGLGEKNVLLQQGGLHLGRGAERNAKQKNPLKNPHSEEQGFSL